MISNIEKAIIKALQEGLPLVSRPFKAMAEKLGISEEALIDTIQDMKARGLIRRFGAAVRHQDLGYSANAMVVWDAPGSEVERAGKIFSGFPGVSHCYERQISGDWEYNLFTMVHGRAIEDCHAMAGAMSKASGLSKYRVLFSTEELKKISMKYFIE
ncbi:MAG: siroheme decarboxylase subunit beta [Desulfocucumaceae bacterium]